MPTWLLVLIGCIALWCLQALGMWYQTSRYFRKIRELQDSNRAGFLGAGHSRRRFGRGAVVIIVADPQLRITRFNLMRGITVFAPFNEMTEYHGLTIAELQTRMQAEPEKSSFRDATTSAINQILRVEREGVAAKQQPQQVAHA